jgi:hypothetical protein
MDRVAGFGEQLPKPRLPRVQGFGADIVTADRETVEGDQTMMHRK